MDGERERERNMLSRERYRPHTCRAILKEIEKVYGEIPKKFTHYFPANYKDIWNGCIADIVNQPALQCCDESGAWTSTKASIAYPARLDAPGIGVRGGLADEESIEMDLPVCEGDEEEMWDKLKDAGCEYVDEHVHSGVTHLHTVCPVEAVEPVMGEVLKYVKEER